MVSSLSSLLSLSSSDSRDMFSLVKSSKVATSLAVSGVAGVSVGATLGGLGEVPVVTLVGETVPVRFRLLLVLLAGELNQTDAGLLPACIFEGVVVVR